MGSIATNLQNSFAVDPSNAGTDALPGLDLNSSRDSRKIHMPETRTGLGSTEGDLISMVKKYLEIVGLVFFVWLLGK